MTVRPFPHSRLSAGLAVSTPHANGEGEGSIDRHMPISAKDFAEFLWAHNANWHCSFCNHDKFQMNVQGTNIVADLCVPVQQAGLAPMAVTHNFYALSCQRCGNTNWFHKAAVHRWLGTHNLVASGNQP